MCTSIVGTTCYTLGETRYCCTSHTSEPITCSQSSGSKLLKWFYAY